MARKLGGAWHCGGAILEFFPNSSYVRVAPRNGMVPYFRKLRLISRDEAGWVCRVGNETVSFQPTPAGQLNVEVRHRKRYSAERADR